MYFMAVLFKKIEKQPIFGTKHAFCFMVAMATGWHNNINYEIKSFAIRVYDKSPSLEENDQKF